MHSPQRTGNTPLASPLLPAGIGRRLKRGGNRRKDDLTRYLVLPSERREGEFSTVAGTADRVGTSKRTIHSWVSAGKVRYTWRGNCILVWMPSLENYLMQEVRGRV